MTSRKIWILVSGLIAGFVLLVGAGGFVLLRFLAPTFGPLFKVRSEIVKVYPSSNPNVSVFWQNGRKTLRVSVAAGFNPMQDTASAQAMAERVAQIVREHYDLSGCAGITVNVEQRRSAGIVHVSTSQTFNLPVSPPATE